MMKARLIAFPIVAALALAACSSNSYADVVRFHTNQPITRGTLAIVPADPAAANSLEFRTHAETVAVEMRRLGYTTGLPADQVQYLAILDITQVDAQGNVTRPGMTVGAGVGTSSGNVGLGANVAVPVGSSSRRNPAQRTTTLSVQIQNRADGAKVWEGRATKQADAASQAATATSAVPALAGALFSDFPGKPGVTQQVRL